MSKREGSRHHSSAPHLLFFFAFVSQVHTCEGPRPLASTAIVDTLVTYRIGVAHKRLNLDLVSIYFRLVGHHFSSRYKAEAKMAYLTNVFVLREKNARFVQQGVLDDGS